MLNLFRMLMYGFMGNIFIPFKIYGSAFVKKRKGCSLQLAGRVTIGNPRSLAVVSKLPANLYFGSHSEIVLGSSVCIGPGVNIIVKDNATLLIGDNTYFTSDMHLEVVNSVTIGKNCAISWGVTIIDDDHHRVLSDQKNTAGEKQVVIKDHVWVGCNVTILKGTQIGMNSIVAAGSVVKGSFPDNCLIGGNPAKVIKENINWE